MQLDELMSAGALWLKSQRLCGRTTFDVLGRSYTISSQRTLIQCLESLVQKCQSGVVVCFEKLASDGLLFGNGMLVILTILN